MLELNNWLLLQLLRWTGRTRRFRTVGALERSVRVDRARNNGEPPASVVRTLQCLQDRLSGVRCYHLSREDALSECVHVLYLHGGAHCTQISAQHWRFLADLARNAPCHIHVPLFGLTPEASHQSVLQQIHGVWQSLQSQDTLCGKWMVMGDSSGAGLALSFAQQLLAGQQPLPASLVLISPWLDLSLRHARLAADRIDDPWLALPGMEHAASWWAGAAPLDAAPVSPLFGPLAGLPPTTVFIGTRDLLVGECRELHQKAQAVGLDMELIEGDGQIHVWPILPMRQGRAARSAIAERVRRIATTEVRGP